MSFTKASLFFFFLLYALHAVGQPRPCGSDLIRTNPKEKERINRNLYAQSVQHHSSYRVVPVVIPVAVHLLSFGGPEEIGDSLILASIDELNLRFQNAAPYFDSTGHVAEFQFCLASVDPNGQFTSGITRDTTAATINSLGDFSILNYNNWEPYLYCNIWVVRSINSGAYAGYSWVPGNAAGYQDGIVIGYNYLGGSTLTHEMGHYLGLWHTFSGASCQNQNCLIDGDAVCDTPPDSTSDFTCRGNSCSSDAADTLGQSPFTTDVDELPNYMDYTSCPLSFSQGQVDRMHAYYDYLRSTLSLSNACGLNPGVSPPVASFTDSIAGECSEGMVYFSNLSQDAFRFYWDFNGDNVVDDSTWSPSHLYTSTGTYTVNLIVKGAGGWDTTSQQIFVRYRPGPLYPLAGYNGVVLGNDTAYTCRGTEVFFHLDGFGPYLWCDSSTAASLHFFADSSFVLWYQITDGTGYVWSNVNCHPVYVNVLDVPPPASIYTNDTVMQCPGNVVTLHSVFPPGAYTFQWIDPFSPIPGANDSILQIVTSDWMNSTYALELGNNTGCTSQSNLVTVSAFAYPVQQGIGVIGDSLYTNWGQIVHWYRDGILIPGAEGMGYMADQTGCYTASWAFVQSPACLTFSSDTVCLTITGIQTRENKSETIRWNNALSSFVLPAANDKEEFSVYSLAGTLVQKSILTASQQFVMSELRSGCYVYSLVTKTESNHGRIVIIREE